METMPVAFEERYESIQPESLEGLISTYFDRTYLVLNAFIADPRTCLELSEDIFRTVESTGQLSEKAIFCALANRVRDFPLDSTPMEDAPVDSVLCWLIKESSDLSYGDISDLMNLERDQVKNHIAQIRGLFLG